VHHTDDPFFEGVASEFNATRYHSLAVVDGTVPDVLEVTARANGIIMGLQHRTLPLHGVQFHPESVLTEGGHRLLANWLTLTGESDAVARSADLHPLVRP
jgi:para-aminobenzoate synthetase component 2